MSIDKRKLIVVSGVNLVEGGPLKVILDCLKFLDENIDFHEYKVMAYVHKRSLFPAFRNVEIKEFKEVKSSWIKRVYFEYFGCKKLTKEMSVFLWLGLHDISSNIYAERRAVYCHNATMFQKIKIKDIFLQPKVFLFTLFYKYLYNINIRKNNYVIVQQNWIREAFIKEFRLEKGKVILSAPFNSTFRNNTLIEQNNILKKDYTFFYPAYPRSFKNFEILGEALKLLDKKGVTGIKFYWTLSGDENSYSRLLYKKYGHLKSIEFIGILDRNKVEEFYKESDYLIFPSTLETWGLPISEFKEYNKPMLLANLPYAYETVGNYNQVSFFDVNNPEELANIIEKIKSGNFKFGSNTLKEFAEPLAHNWKELFNLLLK